MPRIARLQVPDVPLHIVQRGHNRMTCFADDKDHELYLGLIEQFGRACACTVHAYVLMTNHVHLLLTPARLESASDLMRAIGQRYVQHFNRKYQRTGSLWEGRFHSSLVDAESYFFACQRYVELNPVRAGLATYPGQYRWSSHRANAEGVPSRIVVPHGLYLALGCSDRERQRAYRALFDRRLSAVQVDAIRGAIKGNRPLGDAKFLGRMVRIFGSAAIKGHAGRPRKPADGDCEQASLLQGN